MTENLIYSLLAICSTGEKKFFRIGRFSDKKHFFSFVCRLFHKQTLMKNKRILTIIYPLFCLGLAAQDTTKTISTDSAIIVPELQKDESGRGKMEVIVKITGAKDQLFIRAKEWYLKTYNSGESAVQMDDKEAGIIVGKGITDRLTYTDVMGIKKDAGYFSYQITTQFKEGKYRCIIDNITYKRGYMVLKEGADIAEDYPNNWGSLAKGQKQREWRKMKEQAIAHLKIVLTTFQTFMAEASAKKKDDGW